MSKWRKNSPLENDAVTQLVQSFYIGWNNLDDHPPARRELKQAEDLISRCSADNLTTTLPVVFRRMKCHLQQARAFGASLLFWPEAVKAPRAAASSADITSKPSTPSILESPSEAEKRHQQAKRKKRLRKRWKSLTSQQQITIRVTVYEHAETFVRLRIEELVPPMKLINPKDSCALHDSAPVVTHTNVDPRERQAQNREVYPPSEF